MIEAVSFNGILNNISRRNKHHKLVGILFCHPNSPLGKEEILENLDYFHRYSAEHIDFYCAGYGAYWPDKEEYIDQQVVARVGNVSWLFSNKKFIEVIKELEKRTSWKYSGETELILLNTDLYNPDKLDFQSTIVCNLERMKKDKAFTSVRSFFQKIFSYSKQSVETWQLSDELGIKIAKNSIIDFVLSLLPSNVSQIYKIYRRGQHLVIKDISKKI